MLRSFGAKLRCVFLVLIMTSSCRHVLSTDFPTFQGLGPLDRCSQSLEVKQKVISPGGVCHCQGIALLPKTDCSSGDILPVLLAVLPSLIFS